MKIRPHWWQKFLFLASGMFLLAGAGAMASTTVLAWEQPAVTALCASSTSNYDFQVILANETGVSSAPTQTLDYSWGSEDTANPTGSFTEPTVGGTFVVSLQRDGNETVVYIWYGADHTAVGSATANGTACATPTPTPCPACTGPGPVNGVSIIFDSGSTTCDLVYAGSPCFGPPYTDMKPGDTTTLTLGVDQENTENADATVDLTWTAGQFVYVGNGDTSAVCTSTADSVSCVYTDFAHQYKYDSYTFTVGNNAAGSTATVNISATVGDYATGGIVCTTADIVMAVPSTPTPTPTPTPTATATPTATPTAAPIPPTGAGTGGTGSPIGMGLILFLVGLALLGFGVFSIRHNQAGKVVQL